MSDTDDFVISRARLTCQRKQLQKYRRIEGGGGGGNTLFDLFRPSRSTNDWDRWTADGPAITFPSYFLRLVLPFPAAVSNRAGDHYHDHYHYQCRWPRPHPQELAPGPRNSFPLSRPASVLILHLFLINFTEKTRGSILLRLELKVVPFELFIPKMVLLEQLLEKWEASRS